MEGGALSVAPLQSNPMQALRFQMHGSSILKLYYLSNIINALLKALSVLPVQEVLIAAEGRDYAVSSRQTLSLLVVRVKRRGSPSRSIMWWRWGGRGKREGYGGVVAGGIREGERSIDEV